MRKTFLTLLILLILSACKQRHASGNKSDSLTFKILLHPSFDEKAQIILTKDDTQQAIQFLLLNRQFSNKPPDTFYFKRILLSSTQFDTFDSLVIEKTRTKQPRQWTGCCDGMPVQYLLIHGTDSSSLSEVLISNPTPQAIKLQKLQLTSFEYFIKTVSYQII
ncbi:hypothetical protein [Niastella populi]|uniref:Lipoprotein n=1 Tax=Niastella populi TaxID=550983 RepID=A0A1V9EGP2_9BACT|nr:hypothetical protein [Niastella populi]OQP45300.1 hypothetical protein A4R26_32320 [Niastella populi]